MSCNNHNPISAFIAGGGGGGGSVNTGVLQTLGGGALSGTLQTITDQSSNQSPLQLSTNAVTISSSLNGNVSLIFQNTNSGGFGQLWNAGNGLSTYILQWRSFDTSGAGGRIYPEGMFIGAQLVPSARLHVRGDGTNPIARFEASGGLRSLAIESSGDLIRYGTGDAGMYILNQSGSSSISGQAIGWQTALSSFAGHGFRIFNVYDQTYTSGTGGLLDIGALGGTFAAAAGSANFRPLSITYTINNSGAQSGTATGIFLNATETALNGMTHNLMDLQVGGSSKTRIDNSGSIYFANFQNIGNDFSSSSIRFSSGEIRMKAGSNGFVVVHNTGTATDVLTFSSANGTIAWGTTNAFPAIKRNSAAIDFRTADDTGFCNVRAATINCVATIASSYLEVAGNMVMSASEIYAGSIANARINVLTGGVNIQVNGSTLDTSAIFQLNSTTKGFLPPRMDDAQRAAITAPAVGLIVYQTNGIEGLYIYKSTGWTFVI
jgi:hypothetical protein